MLGGVLPKSRCRFLHLDLGNTEVVPWDLGKRIADVRVQKFACGHRKQPYYYILPWFFPQWIRGPSLRFRHFLFADLLARGTPNPSPPQICRITIFYFICLFYLSTQPKLDDRWPESAEEQSLLLLVWRHYILQDTILKMYYMQTRRVVSRQYLTNTR